MHNTAPITAPSNQSHERSDWCLTPTPPNQPPRITAQIFKLSVAGPQYPTLPGGTFSEATGINNHREVVGYSNSGTNSAHAIRWTECSGMRDLGTLEGGYYSEAFAINQAGDIAGMSNAADGDWHAFLWTEGKGLRALDYLPGGESAGANGLNNHRHAVGGSGFGGPLRPQLIQSGYGLSPLPASKSYRSRRFSLHWVQFG